MIKQFLKKEKERVADVQPTATVWQRLRRNRMAMIGLLIVLSFIAAAIFAPYLAPYDPLKTDWGRARQGPSKESPLGRDELGRDILSRIIYGARISLWIGIIAVGIGLIIGVPIGAVSGFYGGKVDLITQRLIDIMLAFPGILLAIVIVAMLGPGLRNAMIAVGIATVPIYTRLVRGSVLSIKEQDYVSAARALGAGDTRVILRHVLPNCLAPLIVQSTLHIAVAILYAAGLGFLGLGAQPPTPEWGLMLSRGREYLRIAWHIATFPGIAIMLAVLGFNLLGDGLRDALDPRLKGR